METASDQQVIFEMSAEDVPEEALSRESYAFLADTYHDLSATVKMPLAAAPDAAAAAAALLGRQVLILARRFLSRALYFILIDKRYHPDAQIRVDARGTFSYNAKLPQDFQNLLALSAEARRLMPSVPTAVADELRTLHLCADIFFELLERVFPLREKLAAFVQKTKKDPFAAVTVGEPRRSQLIAVIKYTFEHPIEYDSKTRDAFTLSDAVRAVWQKNHAAWEKIPGGYETYDALKGACYGLQKKQNDPFRYR